MGLVTEHLRNSIIKQVAGQGVVVWYDPERRYTAVAETLDISNTAVTRYEDSFFALRQAVEPLLESANPPRLVIYVPLDQAGTHHALIELETAGAVMRPAQQPPALNTRLAVIARNALKTILSPKKVAEIEKQVEAGKLTLAELDDIADKGGDVAGVISVIFNTSNPQDVALAFLTTPAHDADIIDKQAGAELAQLLQNAFAGSEQWSVVSEQLPVLREQLAQHILVTDFLAAVKDATALPAAFSSHITPHASLSPAARETCLNLAQTWRLRRDLRESYIEQAQKVGQSLNLARLNFDLDQIETVQTFVAIEQNLQRNIAAVLLTKAGLDLIEIAQLRRPKFWSEAMPDIQAGWALIANSGQVLLEANRIEQELKHPLNVKTIFERYTGSAKEQLITDYGSLITDEPWCLLDTYHRHMERRCHHFDFDLGGRHANLEKLIAKARDRYMAVGAKLAQTFLEQYQQAKFRVAGVPRQVETYEKQVKPRLTQGKTAYIWVDALRFEMARDLAQTLTDEFSVDMQAAVGTVPTITEIGMALLPNARHSPTGVSVGGGKLGLNIDGTIIKDRKGRVDYLVAHAGQPVFTAKLEDLVPKPKKKIQTGITKAGLILVTSQEIDLLCEGDNIHLARRAMDEILHELRRVLRILVELGGQSIVLTADHGYLFGEELGEDMKIAAPGGNTVDLHRRVWIGKGGDSHPAYLRTDLANFGLSDEFELVTPKTFAIFKVPGGAKAYFHGGLSPQELIIPILSLTPKQQASSPGQPGDIIWQLKLGSSSHKITRFCSVQVSGQSTGLFEIDPPKVRVEVRTPEGEVFSTPVTASDGFEEATGNTQLAAKDDDPRAIAFNSIAVHITDPTPRQNIILHLIDAASGVELARLEGLEVTSGI